MINEVKCFFLVLFRVFFDVSPLDIIKLKGFFFVKLIELEFRTFLGWYHLPMLTEDQKGTTTFLYEVKPYTHKRKDRET